MPRSERGKLGAERRWGPPRRLRIGDLTPDQRRLVLALIEAHRTVNRVEGAGANSRVA